jgi:uncharacterized RDD family membrane protein YckC
MTQLHPPVPNLRYAGLVSRAAAFILDTMILAAFLSVAGMLLRLLADFFSLAVPRPINGDILAGAGVVGGGLLFQLAYFVFFWVALGQTPGKILLGLRVARADGQPVSVVRAIARYFGYWVSAIPLALGFLWVLVDRRRRGWHDKLAGTCVVFTAEFSGFHQRVERARHHPVTPMQAGNHRLRK